MQGFFKVLDLWDSDVIMQASDIRPQLCVLLFLEVDVCPNILTKS
jgi:hypothetical protein